MRYLMIALALCVAGCAGLQAPSTYGREGITGGYSEKNLGNNKFQVCFTGNGYTPTDVAKDYALLRSAEVAIKNGYNYFIVEDSKLFITRLDFGPYREPADQPKVTLMIACYKDNPGGQALEAEAVKTELRKKHNL